MFSSEFSKYKCNEKSEFSLNLSIFLITSDEPSVPTPTIEINPEPSRDVEHTQNCVHGSLSDFLKLK